MIGEGESTDKVCRMTRAGAFSLSDFNRMSCTNCYKLLAYVINQMPLTYNTTSTGYFVDPFTNNTLDPTKEADKAIIEKSMTELQMEKWRDCCKEATLCCKDVMLVESQKNTFINGSCPSVWDGWSCHPTTLAGRVSRIKCPPHIVENTCNSILDYAYFPCDNSGHWYKNDFGNEWVDYGPCLQSIIPIKERSIYVNIITQSISLFFLVLGLIIFFSYRQLRVNRITLHKNFFASLIFHSLAQIIWESVIMKTNLTDSEKYINSNNPGCIFINVLVQYTRTTNYFWMFCESLYLHKLLVTVFKEDSNLLIFYLIGWGIPFVLCCVYSICTFLLYNHSCWTQNIYLMYILTVPNILTILLNFVFLINVIRVLYKKLTAANSNEPHQYRRAVRATLILVPLFGLHLILSPIVLCDSTPGSQFYNLMNRLIESLQGFIVAIIYCFLNAEVTTLLKKSIVESKPFKVLIYDGSGHLGNQTMTTSDMDYADTSADGANGHLVSNPLKRLKRSLLRSSFPRETTTREYRLSLSASRYPDQTRL